VGLHSGSLLRSSTLFVIYREELEPIFATARAFAAIAFDELNPPLTMLLP
jgi:hypothetical protein